MVTFNESLIDGLLAVISIIFAWYGYRHGRTNAYWISPDQKDRKLLHRYYAAVAVFGAAVIGYGLEHGKTVWIDLPWVTFFVLLIHSSRFYTDWLDLKDRPEKLDLLRPLADFCANLFTVWFAIFISASRDWSLGFVGAFFGLMFIAKEMYFRMKVDVFDRPDGTRNTSQGGGGRKTDPRLRPFQTFMGRYMKSYFYVVTGFGVLYLMVPVVFPGTPDFASRFGGGKDHVIDSFWFVLACLTQFPSGLPGIVMALVVLEFGASVTLVLFLFYLAFTKIAPRQL